MPKLMRLKTVEKLLRSLGHADAADRFLEKAAPKAKLSRDFKLRGEDARQIERRIASGEVLMIRRWGKNKLAFRAVDFKYNFQRPEVLERARRARAAVA